MTAPYGSQQKILNPFPMKSSSPSSSEIKHDTQVLVADITQLMADAEEMLSESTSHHAEEKVALLRSRLARRENRAIARYLDAKDKIARFSKRTDATIRACPYESLALALGLGIVLGGIFFRRED